MQPKLLINMTALRLNNRLNCGNVIGKAGVLISIPFLQMCGDLHERLK